MTFQQVLSSIAELLWVKRSQKFTTKVVEWNEKGNAVTRIFEASPNFISAQGIYRQRTVSSFHGPSSFCIASVAGQQYLSWTPTVSKRGKPWKVSLSLLHPSLMPSMKPEEVIQRVTWLSTIGLSSAGKEAYSRLVIAFESVCRIQDLPFQDLLLMVKQLGDDITEAVYAVFLRPSLQHPLDCRVGQFREWQAK